MALPSSVPKRAVVGFGLETTVVVTECGCCCCCCGNVNEKPFTDGMTVSAAVMAAITNTVVVVVMVMVEMIEGEARRCLLLLCCSVSSLHSFLFFSSCPLLVGTARRKAHTENRR